MKRLAAFFLVTIPLYSLAPPNARADNAMQEITRSVLYGGAAGLTIGAVILVANEGGNAAGVLKWGFVTGSFVGLGYGIHEATRPRNAHALIEWQDGHLRLQPPTAERSRESARLDLVAFRF